MKIKFFKPKSEILQKYIEGYYFLTNDKSEPIIEYYTFPNNYSIVSIMQNADVEYSENAAVVKECNKNQFTSDLICHYKKPIKLKYEGTISELTFYFKPLGLNAFLENSLCSYTSTFFTSFIPFEDYKETFTKILNEKNIDSKIEFIENYWLSKLKGFEHPFLESVLIDLKKEFTINEIAKKHDTTRQNITKQFEINLCKSPSEYKKIHRFREALKSQISTNSKNNLTSLSYDLMFYDQSHLIKDFKSLTGFTPKKFFKNLTPQENGEVNWLFV